MPTFTLAELAAITGAELKGDPDCNISGVASLENAIAGELSFLNSTKFEQYLATTQASVVILQSAALAACPCNALVCEDPYLAYAKAATALTAKTEIPMGIHPSAVVDKTAQISSSATVSAHATIGANVKIADQVFIGPNCVVMDDCIIGEGSRLTANVTLCARTQLGRDCLIQPGSVLGSDGFGLANEQGRWVHVPQLGRLVLGDGVEVGANCAIDRGALHDTRIADGVKLDNLIHIGHNVQIGKHTAIAGCTGIAGSAKIGDYCMIAGAAAINGHVEIADHVHISGMTAVTRSLSKAGQYTSTLPAIPHAQWQKNFIYLKKLHNIVQRLKSVEKLLVIFRRSNNKGSR